MTENFYSLEEDSNFQNFDLVSNSLASNQQSHNYHSDENTDEDKRKLFVARLSYDTTDVELQQYFSQFGEIESSIVKYDNTTGCSRGYGFVVFASEDSMAAVKAVTNHMLDNRRLDVRLAKPPKEPQRKVFVGGLDPDVTEEKITEYFGSFGKIETLDLPYDAEKGKRKPFIFVTYFKDSDAKNATQQAKQNIEGRMCDVKLAVPPVEAKKQREAALWGGTSDYYGGGGAAAYGQFYQSYRPPPYETSGMPFNGYGGYAASRGRGSGGGGKMMQGFGGGYRRPYPYNAGATPQY